MNFEEFKTMLNTELNYLSINLSDIKLEQFYTYMNLLIEWNKKINLKLKTTGFSFFIKDLRL